MLTYDLNEKFGLKQNIQTGDDTLLTLWSQAKEFSAGQKNSTTFGYVHAGCIILSWNDIQVTVKSGYYFCAPDSFTISPVNDSAGFLCTKNNFNGIFSFAGPLENKGRLKYIDGCSDSLIMSPVKMGDPCFNMLYVPGNVDQTTHTHPSVRIGLIQGGLGICKEPEEDYDLMPGTIFVLPQDTIHSFHTERDQFLRIVVYHPDSDFGATDEIHPMINRTII